LKCNKPISKKYVNGTCDTKSKINFYNEKLKNLNSEINERLLESLVLDYIDT
tara:strand:+ start:339 stop:494 length:156 start_codon:yes stop_codon:yes gene_type:complete